jgi:MFS family permease
MGFFDGLRFFAKALVRVWLEPELRRWYFRTLFLTLIISGFLVASIFALGTWAFSSFFENMWSTTLALLLWTLILFYISGLIATVFLNVLVLFVGGESALAKFYFREKISVDSEIQKSRIKQQLKDRSHEILSLLRSLAIACIFWPLLLVPFLMPLGVLIFSWAMAGDALVLAKRICHEKGYPALTDSKKASRGTMMGLGLMPSSMALFPVIGWALLPLLQAAGLEMQVSHLKDRDEDPTE